MGDPFDDGNNTKATHTFLDSRLISGVWHPRWRFLRCSP